MSFKIVSDRPEPPSVNQLLRQILDLYRLISNSNCLIFEPAVVRHSN